MIVELYCEKISLQDSVNYAVLACDMTTLLIVEGQKKESD